jgi:hypothetical protein
LEELKVTSNPLGLTWWCWLGTLECAPLKVSGLIFPGVNFSGLVWLLQKKKKLSFPSCCPHSAQQTIVKY